MVHIKIFTWSYCPFCQNAKKLLQEKSIDFEEIVLDNDEKKLEEIRKQTGQRTVPQIFIDETFIGGYSELEELSQKGGLDKLA